MPTYCGCLHSSDVPMVQPWAFCQEILPQPSWAQLIFIPCSISSQRLHHHKQCIRNGTQSSHGASFHYFPCAGARSMSSSQALPIASFGMLTQCFSRAELKITQRGACSSACIIMTASSEQPPVLQGQAVQRSNLSWDQTSAQEWDNAGST